MLRVSVIVHFMLRQRSRDWVQHLVVPLIGIVIVGYVLLNMAPEAKIAGLVWLAIGALALVGLKFSGRRLAIPV